MGQENWKKRSSEGGKRRSHVARFLGRVGTPRLPLRVPFRLVFDSDASSYPKDRQYILPSADLISHRAFSSDLCFGCFCLSGFSHVKLRIQPRGRRLHQGRHCEPLPQLRDGTNEDLVLQGGCAARGGGEGSQVHRHGGREAG